MKNPFAACRREFDLPGGGRGRLYSLPALAEAAGADVARLPVSLRIVLESALRNCGGAASEEQVLSLANWRANAPRAGEVPFNVARVILQDLTGVPLIADLAAMRDAAAARGAAAEKIEPLVPVDLVVDHSVQVDYYASPDAARLNMEMEFARNRERYQFLKWGANAFRAFRVVPPGVGIVHQVNLEYLARGVMKTDDGDGAVYFPDTLVGTDSHTTMINGVGVVGWGVGGIEAEAAMLGQPIYLLAPDVVGVCLRGRLAAGVTATDLVLAVTETLRRAGVVGKFVEFFGEGAAALTAPDRATIANMAPEYGATMGYFPPDDNTIAYFRATGRDEQTLAAMESYFKTQGMFGIPREGECDYSQTVEIDLTAVTPSVAGPRRPQDRIALSDLKANFNDLLARPPAEGGYGKTAAAEDGGGIQNGDVLIAAITSCTNTSNPSVLLAAGLLARKAAARGLKAAPRVKTSLAPGSRVVTDYLARAGLLEALEQVGFYVVGYGCTTCIGNSGPLDAAIEREVSDGDIVAAAVLSGNRNFEARIHQSIRANFLMSPPLVVAFALAGRVGIDFAREPLGVGDDGKPVYLRELWPSADEVAAAMHFAVDPENYRRRYGGEFAVEPWGEIAAPQEARYAWRDDSTYIRKPPFFADGKNGGGFRGARILGIFGDSVTTDHISPAGAIRPSSPAGAYLKEHGVAVRDFNTYGARRGNHEVMMRGTFANVRIRNLMAKDAEGGIVEGGVTAHYPSGEILPIFDAARRYQAEGTPLVVFGGREYGTGSSRDWAAKGTLLLGVKAVIVRGFERIHRSNLAGMGVLPCEFADPETSAESLGLRGDETVAVAGLENGVTPRMSAELIVRYADGREARAPLTVRIDTPAEADYFARGGILPFVLEGLDAR